MINVFMIVLITGMQIKKILIFAQNIIIAMNKIVLVLNLNLYIMNNVQKAVKHINIKMVKRIIVQIINHVVELRLMVKIILVLIMILNIV